VVVFATKMEKCRVGREEIAKIAGIAKIG